jgi:hypothetical protein
VIRQVLWLALSQNGRCWPNEPVSGSELHDGSFIDDDARRRHLSVRRIASGSLAEAQSEVPELTNAELVQLRVRVIALENLVISLLAEAPDRQLDLAREMAAFISPRPGFTCHPLTIHAATHMIDLVDRAGHFRTVKP